MGSTTFSATLENDTSSPLCVATSVRYSLPIRSPLHVPWHFESLDFRVNERKLSGYLAHFHPLSQEKLVPHYHPGVELLYLIEGKLAMTIGVETFQLSAGDSIYFDSMQKHTYRSLLKSACTAIVVTTGSPQ